MSEFLAILILAPTAAVLVLVAGYITAMFAMFVAAGLDEIVVAAQHSIHHTEHPTHA